MRKTTLPMLLAGPLLLSLATAQPAAAVSRCSVKIDKRNGTLMVDASGVTGSLRWGDIPTAASRLFWNGDTCVTDTQASRCTLGEPATEASRTPPFGCSIYLADDGPESCEAWIRGCTPGVRTLESALVDSTIAGIHARLDTLEGLTGVSCDLTGTWQADWTTFLSGQGVLPPYTRTFQIVENASHTGGTIFGELVGSYQFGRSGTRLEVVGSNGGNIGRPEFSYDPSGCGTGTLVIINFAEAIATRISAPAYCSNGVVDAGEACDDGNLQDNDGCSPFVCRNGSFEPCDFCTVPSP